MTVDPRLRLTPGEYLIHPDGSASKVADKRNMTVDEILATGQYTDRRGREWLTTGPGSKLGVAWAYYEEPFGVQCVISTHHLRLLIERDLHRDECAGLRDCFAHPVPHVVSYQRNAGVIQAYPAARDHVARRSSVHTTFSQAMDAARALAVGE